LLTLQQDLEVHLKTKWYGPFGNLYHFNHADPKQGICHLRFGWLAPKPGKVREQSEEQRENKEVVKLSDINLN